MVGDHPVEPRAQALEVSRFVDRPGDDFQTQLPRLMNFIVLQRAMPWRPGAGAEAGHGLGGAQPGEAAAPPCRARGILVRRAEADQTQVRRPAGGFSAKP